MLIGGLASIERAQARRRAASSVVDVVDMGVTLHVVRKPVDGTAVPIPPRESDIVRTHHLGGTVQIDRNGARYIGASASPRAWACSEDQEKLILHDDDRPPWTLIQGSEGAGKTVCLAMWTICRVLENVGRNVLGAITAPSGPRLEKVKAEIEKLWDPAWYRWSERKGRYEFHAGPRVLMQHAVQRSAAAGSPIQGDSWEWCGSDELQDHFEREADIMSRGRGARGGRFKRLCTSTAKRSTLWMTFRTGCQASQDWSFVRMLGPESPFVDDEHWRRYRRSANITEAEWRRRVMAEDVGPERQVYYNWARTFANGKPANLRAVPPGAVDITADIMRPWAGDRSIGMLVGHDPGKRQHVSVFLKAYRLRDQRDPMPRWFVVDEVTSPTCTIEKHARDVLDRLRKEWGCHALDRFTGKPDPESPTALVRIDPHTRSGDEHPGQDVYTIWRRIGFHALPAAYRAGTSQPATIKRLSRIDMVNALLSSVAEVGEVRRLFVAVDDRGNPTAPMLLRAFESMQANESGVAESDRKDADDLSHWPAAVGYALWQVESPRARLAQEAA